MKGKRVLFVTVGLGLVIFVLTTSFLSQARAVGAAVVVTTPIQAGTRLDSSVVTVRQIPKAAILPGAYSRVQDVLGQTITVARMPGDQVTRNMVGSAAISAITASLPPDHRAIAVRVDRATGLAGMLQVGDQVSVVGIVDPQDLGFSFVQEAGEAPPSPTAMVVVPGLKVLLVPALFRYQETPGGGSDYAPVATTSAEQERSVVLLDAPLAPFPLTPEGPEVSPVELLALLNAKGKIHLVLEPATPDYSTPPQGVQLYDLFTAMQQAKEAAKKVEKAKPAGKGGGS